MKKSIAVDGGGYVPGRPVQSGIERIIDGFLSSVDKRDIKLYTFNRSSYPYVHTVPQRGYSSFFLPLDVIKNRDTVFLGFSGVIPKLLTHTNCKKIGFLYDFGFIKYPQFYPSHQKLASQTQETIKRSDIIVVLSEAAKEELAAFFPMNKGKRVEVVQAGIDHVSLPPSDIKNDYFLTVGVIKPVKNTFGVIELFEQYCSRYEDNKTELRIMGRHEPAYFQQIQQSSVYKKMNKRIIFVESARDDEIYTAMASARALINLSHEEGYCFPVLEAAALGAIVIVNDLPVHREHRSAFPQIEICKTADEMMEVMHKSRVKKKRGLITIPDEYTWKSFTKRVLSLI